jgi:hypothetical protein
VTPGAWLRLAVGVLPECWSSPAKMLIRIQVELVIGDKRHNLLERILDPYDNPHDRQWFDWRADLSLLHKGPARIALTATAAVEGQPPTRARVAWGNPRLTGPSDVADASQSRDGLSANAASGESGMEMTLTALKQRIEDLEIENRQLGEEITNKSRRSGESAIRINELENLLAEKESDIENLMARLQAGEQIQDDEKNGRSPKGVWRLLGGGPKKPR